MKQMFVSDVFKGKICSVHREVLKKAAIFQNAFHVPKERKNLLPTRVVGSLAFTV